MPQAGSKHTGQSTHTVFEVWSLKKNKQKKQQQFGKDLKSHLGKDEIRDFFLSG